MPMRAISHIKVNRYTFRKGSSVKIVLPLSEKGYALNEFEIILFQRRFILNQVPLKPVLEVW